MSFKLTTISGTGATAALSKGRNENDVLIAVLGSYTGLQFTVEASPDGTNWCQVAVIDNKTGLLVAGGTTINPTNNAEVSWTFPLGLNFVGVRLNVSAVTGTPSLKMYGVVSTGQPLYSSVAGAAGSFTNGTFSGTLAVTGASTFTGAVAANGGITMGDSDSISFGNSNDVTATFDGTDFLIGQAGTNTAIKIGVDGAGMDLVLYGDTASTYWMWDQSADTMIANGAAPLKFVGTTGQPFISLTDNLADALSIGIAGSTDLLVLTTTDNAEAVSIIGLRNRSSTAVAITGATTLKLSDSGGIFTVSQGAAYDIDLPSPTTGPGCEYEFSLTAPAANDVTITVAGGAATFVGILQNDVTGTVPCTENTLTYKSGVAGLGDIIMVKSIATNLYRVFATCQANGGITIT